MRRLKKVGWARSFISEFVSYLRSGRPRFDTHLPLIPIPIRSERPSLINQRPIADVHQSAWRPQSEATPPFGAARDWSMPHRGDS